MLIALSMTLHLSHQARLSGNRSINITNPLTIVVIGLFLCLENRKKGIKRAKCEKTNIFRYKKRAVHKSVQRFF